MADLKDLAEELMTLNDEHLAQRVIDDSDVQWCLSELYDILSADVAPVVHGRWEQDADGDWYCTNCDEIVAICESGKERTYRKPYCPNCGAKMDEEETDR